MIYENLLKLTLWKFYTKWNIDEKGNSSKWRGRMKGD
jgi:hypothetical protein